MAVMFFATSALVKRYDGTEPGAARMRAMCRRPARHTLLIAPITPVEMASAFNRKMRRGAIPAAHLLGNLALDFRFCTADRVQAAAAASEGLVVEFIA